MPNSQQGLSFVEVMMSMMLIATATLGLVKLHIELEQRSEFSRHRQQALMVMEEKLTWFYSRGATSSLPTRPVADFATNLISGSDDSHFRYQLTWRIEEGGVEGLRDIQIEANWLDRHGEEQSVALETRLFEFGEFER